MALPDMRLLQAAITLAEELNFSRAADRLRLTQPALSKQIYELEGQLGLRLFERNHQSVELTAAGRAFVEEAREAVMHTERAVFSAKSAFNGTEEILNIGKSVYADPFLVSTLLSVRLPLFPSMRIKLWSNYSHELARQVIAGSLDLALITSVPDTPKLTALKVAETLLYIAMSTEDPLAAREAISLDDMEGRAWVLVARHANPHIYDEIQHIAAAKGVRAADTHHFLSAEEASELIFTHDGLAFLSKASAWRIARDGITMRPLNEERLRLLTNLAARSNSKSRLVNEYVKATSRKLTELGPSAQKVLPLEG